MAQKFWPLGFKCGYNENENDTFKKKMVLEMTFCNVYFQ